MCKIDISTFLSNISHHSTQLAENIKLRLDMSTAFCGIHPTLLHLEVIKVIQMKEDNKNDKKHSFN
jgi:hypothetical protein|tara:strand:+ start:498 stop:695 length:198 start_codon:yes stop_codon:yes gene_type:complete